jgi:hypothetical protein
MMYVVTSFNITLYVSFIFTRGVDGRLSVGQAGSLTALFSSFSVNEQTSSNWILSAF